MRDVCKLVWYYNSMNPRVQRLLQMMAQDRQYHCDAGMDGNRGGCRDQCGAKFCLQPHEGDEQGNEKGPAISNAAMQCYACTLHLRLSIPVLLESCLDALCPDWVPIFLSTLCNSWCLCAMMQVVSRYCIPCCQFSVFTACQCLGGVRRWGRGGAVHGRAWSSSCTSRGASGWRASSLLSKSLHVSTTGEDWSHNAAVPTVRDANHKHLCGDELLPTLLQLPRALHDLCRSCPSCRQLHPSQDLKSRWSSASWCSLCHARSRFWGVWSLCEAWKYFAPTTTPKSITVAFSSNARLWLACGVRVPFPAATSSAASSIKRRDWTFPVTSSKGHIEACTARESWASWHVVILWSTCLINKTYINIQIHKS